MASCACSSSDYAECGIALECRLLFWNHMPLRNVVNVVSYLPPSLLLYQMLCKAVDVWSSSVFWSLITGWKGLNCIDLLRWLISKVKMEEMEVFCIVLWAVWRDRNCFIHQKQSRAAEETLDWATNFVLEFQNTYKAFNAKTDGECCFTQVVWCPPPRGYLKLNTDVAVKPNSNFIGIGAVIRDGDGKVITALSKPFPSFFDAELGELLAVREGLLLAKTLKLSMHLVEMDARNASSAINSLTSLASSAGCIIDDIKALCKDVGVLKCQAIPRSGNDKAGMISEGYAWLITASLSNSLKAMDSEIVDSMEGVLGIRSHVPESKHLKSFNIKWKRNLHLMNPNSSVLSTTFFGLWAYDTIVGN
ncbi:hypothetical protein LWI28_010488 [Acer negundo]|uniref:RNase H type-1 domain-containing protein n=1 Tax=Acer negundo TaxID=4023 RepID=A0AAD5J9L4_ACENE|nr:hypothetical protein LWI28_010488 [Acer negundo]